MGMNGYLIINLFVMAKAAVQTTQYQTMGVPNLHSFITEPNSCVLLVNRLPLWNEGLSFTTISDRLMQQAVCAELSQPRKFISGSSQDTQQCILAVKLQTLNLMLG
jgi:hypothetical protein